MAVTMRLWVQWQEYLREPDHEMWRDSYLIRVHDIERRMRQQEGKRLCVLENFTTLDFLLTIVNARQPTSILVKNEVKRYTQDRFLKNRC